MASHKLNTFFVPVKSPRNSLPLPACLPAWLSSLTLLLPPVKTSRFTPGSLTAGCWSRLPPFSRSCWVLATWPCWGASGGALQQQPSHGVWGWDAGVRWCVFRGAGEGREVQTGAEVVWMVACTAGCLKGGFKVVML